MTVRSLLLATSTALPLLLLPALAEAVEPEELGADLKRVFANEGIAVDWTGISGDDAEIVLQGLTAKFDGVANAAAVGTVRLREVTEADGEYRIGETTFPDYNMTEDGTTLAASGISITGLQVPMEPPAGDDVGLLMYESADLQNLSIEQGGKRLMTLGGFNVSIDEPATEADPIGFSGSTETFSVDLSGVEDPNAKAIISQMGYQTLSGGFEMAGSYNQSDGRIVLDEQTVSLDNAGALTISADLSGYTPAVIKSLRETSQKMAEAPEDQQSAQGLAMLGLMQQITFNSATIRFEDDSLTRKVLDVVAEQQGTTADQIANQAKAVLPFALAQLQLPDFATAVSTAVNAFLDDPKSLEITATPATGVPFAQIMATGMSTPQSLVQQLGVSVTANQD